MASLLITKAVASRSRLKRENLYKAAQTEAILGNWYVTLTKLDSGNAFVYVSERTLLSFIMLEGERITPIKLFSSFARGLILVLDMAGHSEGIQDRVIGDYSTGSISPAEDLSLLGSVTNIALDYAAFIDHVGGVDRCDLNAIIKSINSRPSKRLGFDNPFSVTASLLQSVAT